MNSLPNKGLHSITDLPITPKQTGRNKPNPWTMFALFFRKETTCLDQVVGVGRVLLQYRPSGSNKNESIWSSLQYAATHTLVRHSRNSTTSHPWPVIGWAKSKSPCLTTTNGSLCWSTSLARSWVLNWSWVYVMLPHYRQRSLRGGNQHKQSAKFLGPYQVIGCVGSVSYQLMLPPVAKVTMYSTFHSTRWRYQLHSCISSGAGDTAAKIGIKLELIFKGVVQFDRMNWSRIN